MKKIKLLNKICVDEVLFTLLIYYLSIFYRLATIKVNCELDRMRKRMAVDNFEVVAQHFARETGEKHVTLQSQQSPGQVSTETSRFQQPCSIHWYVDKYIKIYQLCVKRGHYTFKHWYEYQLAYNH